MTICYSAGMKLKTLAAFTLLLAFATAEDLKPIMTVPDKVVFQNDFSKAGTPDKANFSLKQGTQWSIEDGVLRGKPSSDEYQKSHKDHKGTEARISVVGLPAEYAMKFSFRFVNGEFTGQTPLIELGHHVTRVQWTTNGLRLLADHDALDVARAPTFKLQTNQWYKALAEVRGEEVVFRFDGGPTLYGSHASIRSEKHDFGIAGLKGGRVELDDIAVWSVKSNATPPGWDKIKESLPKDKPIELAKKKGEKSE